MAPSNANTTSNGTITTDQYAVKIRDQYFHIEIFLYNQIDGYKPLNLPFIFVNSFSLNESLLNWITNGWIILSSDFEVLERGGSSVPGNNVNYNVSTAPNGNTPASTSKNPPYLFRTDGRNRISFRVFPIKTDSTTAENSTFDPNFWELSFDFVIYDVEDLPTNSNQKKLKKYYFWDERFQILSERNI
jgi:hypothetical protein